MMAISRRQFDAMFKAVVCLVSGCTVLALAVYASTPQMVDKPISTVALTETDLPPRPIDFRTSNSWMDTIATHQEGRIQWLDPQDGSVRIQLTWRSVDHAPNQILHLDKPALTLRKNSTGVASLTSSRAQIQMVDGSPNWCVFSDDIRLALQFIDTPPNQTLTVPNKPQWTLDIATGSMRFDLRTNRLQSSAPFELRFGRINPLILNGHRFDLRWHDDQSDILHCQVAGGGSLRRSIGEPLILSQIAKQHLYRITVDQGGTWKSRDRQGTIDRATFTLGVERSDDTIGSTNRRLFIVDNETLPPIPLDQITKLTWAGSLTITPLSR